MSSTCGFCFGYRRASGRFSELATCKMPPPCNEGYSQFKMPGTNTMCCRRTPVRRTTTPRVPSGPRVTTTTTGTGGCPHGKAKCLATGRCVLLRNLANCGRSVTTRSEASVNLRNAKQQLKDRYSQILDGKRKSPGFITNMKTVNGKNSAEKIANINRVLTACRRAGVSLIKRDGKNFKAFSTLVGQCNVKFSRESPSGSILSDRRGRNNLIQRWRARRAATQNDQFNRAVNTPLPDDDEEDVFYDANEFGRRIRNNSMGRRIRRGW